MTRATCVGLVLASLLLAVTSHAEGRFARTNARCASGRSSRGLPCDDYVFEFAPPSGAGMGAVCACGTVTGARGEAMTFSRATSATCTRSTLGGMTLTGIVTGDVVLCAANQPRVEYGYGGVRGLRVEASRTNSCLYSAEIGILPWTLVGTPIILTDADDGPDGTQTADSLEDISDTAFEGVAQSIAVSAGAPSVFSCYLRANSVSSARIINDDTTCNVTSLSGTTWTRAVCADTSASGAAVSVQVLVGTSPVAMGNIYVWGCQYEANATRVSSYIPTTSAAVTRGAETAYLTFPTPMSQEPISMAWTASQAFPEGSTTDRIAVMTRVAPTSGDFVASYFQNVFRCDAVGTAVGTATGGTSVAGDRWACAHDADVLTAYKNSAQVATNTTPKTMAAATVVGVGASPGGLSHLDGIISRVCVSADAARCR